MIRNNHTKVRYDMDNMRKQRKKFVCLNDNIDHSKQESQYVRQKKKKKEKKEKKKEEEKKEEERRKNN